MPEGDITMDAARLQRIAEASAAAMYDRDHCAQAHGIEVTHVAPGRATLTMTVRKDMVNGHDILHGGLCFTLADTAFAFCCNSHNYNTVAHSCSITYTNPGRLGDVLTAEAVESYQQGRNGVTDVRVTNQAGSLIALFRGNSRRINGHLVDHPEFVPADKRK